MQSKNKGGKTGEGWSRLVRVLLKTSDPGFPVDDGKIFKLLDPSNFPKQLNIIGGDVKEGYVDSVLTLKTLASRISDINFDNLSDESLFSLTSSIKTILHEVEKINYDKERVASAKRRESQREQRKRTEARKKLEEPMIYKELIRLKEQYPNSRLYVKYSGTKGHAWRKVLNINSNYSTDGQVCYVSYRNQIKTGGDDPFKTTSNFIGATNRMKHLQYAVVVSEENGKVLSIFSRKNLIENT